MGNFFCIFGGCGAPAITSAPTPVPTPAPTLAPIGGVRGLQAGCNEPIDLQNYNICLDLDFADDRIQYFLNAKDRWNKIITAHVSTAPFLGSGNAELKDKGTIYYSEQAPNTVDDMYMFAKEEFIDGPFGVLGSAGPKRFFLNGLPFAGTMRFDVDDVTRLISEGRFEDTIAHEMGHIFGIGTMWEALGVTNRDRTVYLSGSARAQWQNFYGCNGDINIEQDGGSGTKGSHWDDLCFQNEMMTGTLNRNERNFISRITVGGLQDLGYTVDYNAAEEGAIFSSFCCNTGLPGRRSLEAKMEDGGTEHDVSGGRELGLFEDIFDGITDAVSEVLLPLTAELIEKGALYAFDELSRLREELGDEEDPGGFVRNTVTVFMFDEEGNIRDREYTWEEASSYQQLNLRRVRHT